jgi:hypothetical protein
MLLTAGQTSWLLVAGVSVALVYEYEYEYPAACAIPGAKRIKKITRGRRRLLKFDAADCFFCTASVITRNALMALFLTGADPSGVMPLHMARGVVKESKEEQTIFCSDS